MNPTFSLRQCATWLSFSWPSVWPSTRISPEVGRSIAAIRCSSVDLPDPDGPINATNSPLCISRVTSFSAITWNSSRTYSLVRLCVSMIVSLMPAPLVPSSCLLAHLVAVLQARGRVYDQVLAADQSFFNANARPARNACLHRAPHGFAIQQNE